MWIQRPGLVVVMVMGLGCATRVQNGNTATQPSHADRPAPAVSASKPPSDGGAVGPEPASTAGAPRFAEVYQRVIVQAGCTSGYCHGGGAGGLTMIDEATSYANLFGVKATAAKCGQTLRVSPGSVDASIFWHRVRPPEPGGETTCAPKMPGPDGLPPAGAQLVNDWIAGGALR